MMPQDNATRQRPYWLRVSVTDEWLQFEPQRPREDEGPEPLWIPLDNYRELVRLAEELEAAADRLRGIAEEREEKRLCEDCPEHNFGCARDCEIMAERRRAGR